MKNIFFIFVLSVLISTSSLFAQNTRLQVRQKDGSTLNYEIDSIQKIFTAKNSPESQYIVTNGYTKQGPIVPDDKKMFHNIDSIIVFGDSIKFFAAKNWIGYSITGSTNDQHYPFDSITFSRYFTDTNILFYDKYKYWDCKFKNYYSPSTGCTRWVGDKIYFSQPYGYLKIDSLMNIADDSAFCPISYSGSPWFDADDSGKKFLSIKSRFGYSSPGYLLEYSPELGQSVVLQKTVDSNIVRAEYFNNDSILYYSLGPNFNNENTAPDAGYYFYDIKADKSYLITHYLSSIGTHDNVNGFDVSPDRKKLLIPAFTPGASPFLIQYEFATGKQDTLYIPSFNKFIGVWPMWINYSHTGKKLLYNFYPPTTFNSETYSGSTIGIIDLGTLAEKQINTSPNDEWTWVTLFPHWSSDDTKVVYSAANVSIEPPGSLSGFRICILKLP